MRWLLFVALTAWLSIGTDLAVSTDLRYDSPHTDLTYDHSFADERSKAQRWSYRFRTDAGDLQVVLTEEQSRFSITSDLDGAPSKEVLIVSEAGTADAEIEFAWPELQEGARFLLYGDDDTLARVAGWMPDCAALANGDLALTRARLLRLVHHDYANYLEPPDHLQMLYVALHSAKVLPLRAADCEDSFQPAGGACYYDTSTYSTCANCCELEAGIATALCSGAVARFCRSKWCKTLGLSACGSAIALASSYCTGHNCRGKAGDSGCDPDGPCEGNCMSFCGPGWSSGCGDCSGNGPNHTACCR